MFKVLLADPPWAFADKLPGETRGAAKNYAVLSLDEIRRFPLPPLADDALLFLWRVSSQPEEALSVARAWGFVPKSEIVWVKTVKDASGCYQPGDALAFGMGRYVRHAHEGCLIASRGKGHTLIRNRAVRSIFFSPRLKHSEKPEAIYSIIESLAPGPYAELFARRVRVGWSQWGDELPGGAPHPAAAGAP